MNYAILNRAAAAYQTVQITTASRGQIVVQLYDAVMRFMREARGAHERKDRAAFGERISRAHAVLELLANTLDASHSPTLAERLTALYAYCMRRLITANITSDPAPLTEVEGLLLPLRDAWAIVGVNANP